MVKVKDKQTCEANYRVAISSVPAKYKAGVQRTSGVIQAAKDGQALYVARMQDQSVLDRRLKGLEKVTDQDWQIGAINKGSNRIGPGMEAGAAKQSANWDPCRQALTALNLPARVADSNANIDNRVKPVVAAMKQAVGK